VSPAPKAPTRRPRARKGARASISALASLVLLTTGAFGEENGALWRDAAAASALEPLKSPVAPLLLGASLAAQSDAERQTQLGRLQYVQTMLAFAAADQLAPFKTSFGPLPKVAAGALTGLEGYAAIWAALRNAYFDRWRQNDAADDATWRGELLVGARFFANAAVAFLVQFPLDDGPGLADAQANLGAVSAAAGDAAQAVSAFQKAIAIYESARTREAALAGVDDAFATHGGGRADFLAGARPPPQYYKASAVESAVPTSIAAAAVNATLIALQAKDKAAATAALELVARANAQADRVNAFLLATWPCHPQLAEAHYWRAEQSVLRWTYLSAFEPGAAAEMAKAADAASREFVAALAVALHAGSADDGFAVKRDQYVSFLRLAGKDADAAARELAAASTAEGGGPTPEGWRAILDCGASAN